MQQIDAYHANDQERCEHFLIDDNFLIICYSDTDYLGVGMYFWNHEADARWWKSHKQKECIVKAKINLDAMLDLTDNDVVDYLTRFYNRISIAVKKKFENLAKKKKVNLDNAVGLKLDMLYEAFPEYMKKFDVLKGRRDYDRKQESDFLFGTKLSTKSVDIYCVKEARVLCQREAVDG